MRVLVVEDDPDVADLLTRALREATWACDVVTTGTAALAAVAIYPYDAMVLDLGLPDIDGMEICRRYRKRGAGAPIIMLTARDGLGDRVAGLDAGADDYLPKPFAIEELLARLRALLRRPAAPGEPKLHIADLELDPATRMARRGARAIPLTAREYALLEYLLRNPDRIVTRGQILDHVWDDNFDPIGNVVDVLVSRVRRKISAGARAPLIHTMRGTGYIMSERVPAGAD
jgi:two-component system copper resistance phosphate regulon response regulator CusR